MIDKLFEFLEFVKENYEYHDNTDRGDIYIDKAGNKITKLGIYRKWGKTIPLPFDIGRLCHTRTRKAQAKQYGWCEQEECEYPHCECLQGKVLIEMGYDKHGCKAYVYHIGVDAPRVIEGADIVEVAKMIKK